MTHSAPPLNPLLVGLPLPDQVDVLERAAIIEYCGGFPRETAELMARELWERESWRRNAAKFPTGYSREPEWRYW